MTAYVLTAERLVQHVEAARFMVMKQPAVTGAHDIENAAIWRRDGKMID